MAGQKEQDEMEGGTPGFDQEKRSQAKRLDCSLMETQWGNREEQEGVWK